MSGSSGTQCFLAIDPRDSCPTPSCFRKGIQIVTVVPSPISLLTTNRNELPNKPCKRRRNSTSAGTRGRSAKKSCPTSLQATPCPSSVTHISSHDPVAGTISQSLPAPVHEGDPIT